MACARPGSFVRWDCVPHTSFFEQAHKKDVVERFQKTFRVKDMEIFEREWREWVLALDPSKGVRMDSAHR